MNTLGAMILAQSSSNLVRMLIWMISRSNLNMGQVGSKSRSRGQILEKPYEHSRGHIFSPIFIKLGQDAYLDDVWIKFEYGSGRIKK